MSNHFSTSQRNKVLNNLSSSGIMDNLPDLVRWDSVSSCDGVASNDDGCSVYAHKNMELGRSSSIGVGDDRLVLSVSDVIRYNHNLPVQPSSPTISLVQPLSRGESLFAFDQGRSIPKEWESQIETLDSWLLDGTAVEESKSLEPTERLTTLPTSYSNSNLCVVHETDVAANSGLGSKDNGNFPARKEYSIQQASSRNEKDRSNTVEGNVQRGQLSQMSFRDVDVLLGRGKTSKSHPGNLKFRALIHVHMEQYQRTSYRAEKYNIIKLIIKQIENSGGRFLRCESNKNLVDENAAASDPACWKPAPKNVVYEKVSHALRSRMR